jgi:hypothetical protein
LEDECRVLSGKAKKQKLQAGKESQIDGSKAAGRLRPLSRGRRDCKTCGQAARLHAEPPEKKQERLQDVSGRQAIDYRLKLLRRGRRDCETCQIDRLLDYMYHFFIHSILMRGVYVLH